MKVNISISKEFESNSTHKKFRSIIATSEKGTISGIISADVDINNLSALMCAKSDKGNFFSIPEKTIQNVDLYI